MPSLSVRLRPGVNTNATQALNEAGISSSNMIRFRDGLVEKRGGWTTYKASATSGVPRRLWVYEDSVLTTYVVVGAVNQLVIISGGLATDITPRQFTSQTAPSWSTTNGSAVITIYDPNFSPTTNDFVQSFNPISIGGLLVSGSYAVASVVDATHYTINVGSNATSTVSNGGTVPTFSTTAGSTTITVNENSSSQTVGASYTLLTQLNVGGLTLFGNYTVDTVPSANQFTFQAASVATSTQTVSYYSGNAYYIYALNSKKGSALRGTAAPANDWSVANFGNVLLVCNGSGSTGGVISSWTSGSQYSSAQAVSGAPNAIGIMVADAQQQVIAYGTLTGNLTRTGVSWSDSGSYTTWVASGTNQAGSFPIPTGSVIVGATVAAQHNILWTDIDVWSMSYVGYPLVWGFNKLATGCGLIGQFAHIRLGSSILWMSQKEFWIYDGGGVRPLPCPVWDNVFPLLSAANVWKILGAPNSAFNEAVWFFPSTNGTGENDSYVCYNVAEQTWDYGSMARSAWVDQSPAGLPLGADPSGNVFQHETSPDGAGSAITSSFTTGYFCLSEGEDFNSIHQIRPDFKFPNGTGTVNVSVLVAGYAGDAPTTYGPYSFTAATKFITTRCRGRFVALKFQSSDAGSFWRVGRTQIQFQPSGRR